MRIVIDMQGAQGSSQHRGIGRYTLALARAIIRNKGSNQIFFVVNGNFPESVEAIRAAVDGMLPPQNIRVWYSLVDANIDAGLTSWYCIVNQLLREYVIASLSPNMILVSSLFEGLDNSAITGVRSLPKSAPTSVILYDLIPWIYRETYLTDSNVAAWYEEKLTHLGRANLLLAISESSRMEAINYLNLSPDMCKTISTAADQMFQKQRIDIHDEQALRTRYGLNRQIIMYTGGIDYRKNVDGLIRAYARLPKALRAEHQLAIVCSIQPISRTQLLAIAKTAGLSSDEVVFTDFVSDADLVILYNISKLFIFPSWHEGFGLPALEAMSCGRAVIGANTASLPEVIGRDDALFDPRSDESIAEKMTQVLSNDMFRQELEEHGLMQARNFSWDATAKRVISAFESFQQQNVNLSEKVPVAVRRQKLAYISPLPPQRSGISGYSAELLPELHRHYDIDVIVMQESISDTWIMENCSVRTVEWFKQHEDDFDRVIYHFGNSHFHQHMFALLEEIPGVVVLHDFYLSGVVCHMDSTGYSPGCWSTALYQGHGYQVAAQGVAALDKTDFVMNYPCNLDVLVNARGIIVHSDYSRKLAMDWYGSQAANDWTVIPLLRTPHLSDSREQSRRELGFGTDDFIVCSFGLLAPTKLNDRLINAWLSSSLAANQNCVLVFVGEIDVGLYENELMRTIKQSEFKDRIRITGWVDDLDFKRYLDAADLGVQLRSTSRGETSAAVLDCMNAGLPTIVNANGSMADLPETCVWMLPDAFNDIELADALNTLWQNPHDRERFTIQAQTFVHSNHAPQTCADHYVEAIERYYRTSMSVIPDLTRAITDIQPSPNDDKVWKTVAQVIVSAIPPKIYGRQLMVDISALVAQHDVNSTNLLKTLLESPPDGIQVEPVYATRNQGYRYARQFTFNFLGCSEYLLDDDAIEYRAGDVFLGLHTDEAIVQKQTGFYQQLKNHGVTVELDPVHPYVIASS